ncbi:MAG: peptidoglycan editing factor PgeF, partial [Pseudomonadota bacterium]
ARVAASFDLAHDRLATVHQTHSARAVPIETTPDRPVEADAMVTDTPGLALGILTADCQPVLFADPVHRVIGAAHAGWKGALDGVLEATLDAMEQLGAKRTETHAAIGPTISQRAYEVGPEFLDRFEADNPENTLFFANGEGDRLQFDLVGYGLARLRAAGVASAQWVGHCTYSDPDRFYSYRRSVHRREADYGRLISAICL